MDYFHGTTQKVDPTTSILFVEFEVSNPQKITIQILGFKGALVTTLYEGLVSGDIREGFKLGSMDPGIYLLTIQSNSGLRHQKIKIE